MVGGFTAGTDTEAGAVDREAQFSNGVLLGKNSYMCGLAWPADKAVDAMRTLAIFLRIHLGLY